MELSYGDLDGLDALDHEALGVFCWSDAKPLAGVAGYLDWRMCGALSHAMVEGHFAGRRNEDLMVSVRSSLSVKRVFLFGLGRVRAWTATDLRYTCRHAVSVMRGAGVDALCFAAPRQRSNPQLSRRFVDEVQKNWGDDVSSLLVVPPDEPSWR